MDIVTEEFANALNTILEKTVQFVPILHANLLIVTNMEFALWDNANVMNTGEMQIAIPIFLTKVLMNLQKQLL